MTDRNDLQDFCGAQAERLGAFREWGFMKPTAHFEFVKFLLRIGNRDQITAVIEEVLAGDEFPTLAELSRIRIRLFGPQTNTPVASPDCPECRGTGFTTKTVGLEDYAKPCTCGGKPRASSESDWRPTATPEERAERKRLQPAAEILRRLHAFAPELAPAPAVPVVPPLTKPLTAEDIARAQSEYRERKVASASEDDGPHPERS
jgi:hypothetical protein